VAQADTNWADAAETALRELGRKSGVARSAVIRQLAAERCAVSAEEISATLADKGQRIGRASVYRALESLAETGLLQRIELGDGSSRWERASVGESGHHHHHLLCRSCGQIIPFESDSLEMAINAVASEVTFKVESHDLTLHGTCESCATASSKR